MTKLSYEYRSSHCYSYVFGRSISFRQTEAFQVPTSLKYVIALCGILYSASRIYFLPVMSIFNGHLAVLIWQKWTTYMYYTILYYTILYYTILYYTILYHTILYYTILYYTILYYAMLCYAILYYTILYCILFII